METKNQPEQFDLHAVFDEQVVPLLKQIHAICSENNIPFTAHFAVACEEREIEGEKGTGYAISSSCHLSKERAPMPMHVAHKMIAEGGDFRETLKGIAMTALLGGVLSAAISIEENGGDTDEAAGATKH